MTAPQTNAVSVFGSRAQADLAIAELRRAGFTEDRIALAAQGEDGFNPGTAGKGPQDGAEALNTIVVTVQADQPHAEAVKILTMHGAHDTQYVAR